MFSKLSLPESRAPRWTARQGLLTEPELVDSSACGPWGRERAAFMRARRSASYAASTTNPGSPGLPPYTSRPGVSCLRPIMTPLLEWRAAPISGVIAPLPPLFGGLERGLKVGPPFVRGLQECVLGRGNKIRAAHPPASSRAAAMVLTLGRSRHPSIGYCC